MHRRKGEGTIYKRKDGRFEVAAFVHTDAGIERVRRYAKTRMQAEQLLVELRAKDRNGLLLATKEKKFGEYADHWLSVVKTKIRNRTYVSYESSVRLYIKPALGHKYLTRLNVHDVQQFLDNQLKLGKSPRNLQKMKVVLSSILKRAEAEDLVTRNVARRVDIPPYNPKEVTPWNFNQLRIFLDSTTSHRYFPIYLIMSMYGLRTGEALGLSWSDIDLENGLIHIRHQFEYVDGDYRYTDVKTRAGQRDLPLLEAVSEALLSVPKSNVGPLADLIFKTSGYLPVDNGKLRKEFKQISAEIGLPIITLHHLRHTAATNLKNLNISAKDTQSILGHANITTTLQIYQHADMENKSKALLQIEQKLVG